jgi:hypothetical protein
VPVGVADEFYGLVCEEARVVVFDQETATSQNCLSNNNFAVRKFLDQCRYQRGIILLDVYEIENEHFA